MASHPHGVPGQIGDAEAYGDALHRRFRPGPVGHEPAHEAVGGQDVHEDAGHPTAAGQLDVVVDVLIVAAGDGAGDDQRRGQLDDQLCQLLADSHVLEAAAGAQDAGRKSGSTSSSSTFVMDSSTAMPMWTSEGATPIRLVTRRVPSSRSTRATT